MSAISEFVRALFKSRFLRFAAVGTAGFVVDEIALWFIHHLSALNYYRALMKATDSGAHSSRPEYAQVKAVLSAMN